MSFGVYPFWMVWDFALIEAALQYCQERNVLLVPQLETKMERVTFPSNDPRTLGVGGSNRDDVRKAVGDTSMNLLGCCSGPDVDVVAPCLRFQQPIDSVQPDTRRVTTTFVRWHISGDSSCCRTRRFGF